MLDDAEFEGAAHVVVLRRPPANPRYLLMVALLTVLVSVGLCVAAILAPAPAMALPLVVTVCVGCPLFAGWQVPVALQCLRADRSGSRAIRALRRSLKQLPEIQHPLGL
jgi:hypothetical protein